MVSSTNAEQGYATAAFGAIALALAVIATALLAFSNQQLRIARVALRHAQQDALLDGALVLAADTVMREPQPVRLSWAADVDGTSVQLLAEPEAFKASASHPEFLEKGRLEALSGTVPLQSKAETASLSAARRGLVSQSPGKAWRTCAQSYLSPLSEGRTAVYSEPASPARTAVEWRVGEVWRLAAFIKGRSADAIVRFTGDPETPMAVLDIQRGAAEPPDLAWCHGLMTAGEMR